MSSNNPIVFFDGVCNLCNSSVQFIIRHDNKHIYKFASLQSKIAKSLLLDLGEQINLETIILLQNGKIYKETDAIIKILKTLGWKWKFLAFFIQIVPIIIRNRVYRWISKHRYRWFGLKEQCMISTFEDEKRFLD